MKVDGNGFDDYGNGSSFAFNPTLISVVLFDQAQYISNTAGGINDFSISVDLVLIGILFRLVHPLLQYMFKLIIGQNCLHQHQHPHMKRLMMVMSFYLILLLLVHICQEQKMTIIDPYQVQLRLGNDNDRFSTFRTIRFANNLIGPVPNNSDRAVLEIDTSCPEDSLLQLGYACSAIGVKSVAIGCYSLATGFDEGPNPHVDGGYSCSNWCSKLFCWIW